MSTRVRPSSTRAVSETTGPKSSQMRILSTCPTDQQNPHLSGEVLQRQVNARLLHRFEQDRSQGRKWTREGCTDRSATTGIFCLELITPQEVLFFRGTTRQKNRRHGRRFEHESRGSCLRYLGWSAPEST